MPASAAPYGSRTWLRERERSRPGDLDRERFDLSSGRSDIRSYPVSVFGWFLEALAVPPPTGKFARNCDGW